MDDGVWQKNLGARISRRKAIARAAALGGTAALLAACGGGGGQGQVGARVRVFDNPNPEGPVKRGGRWQGIIGQSPASLDPYRQVAFTTQTYIGGYIYSRLLKYDSGPKVQPTDFIPAPDLAESYQASGDGLEITFRLRQGVKFHNVAPVSGRVLDSEDVTFSYERFSTMPAPQYSNSFKGVVDKVTAPDRWTVVFKLTEPNAVFISLISSPQFLWVMPREVDGGFDPLAKAIGTGPWTLKDQVPSASISYDRNAEYFLKGLPYLDGVDSYVVSEYAQQLAQFQAGNIFTLGPQAADFPSLLRGIKDVRVLRGDIPVTVTGIGFGRGDPNAPFLRDERVRQAISMMVDRKTLIETLNDAQTWSEMGLPLEYRFNNFIPAGLSRWWVDPVGKEMGDTARYFSFNVAEAKKLLSAAGYPNGFETDFRFAAGSVYGTTYPSAAAAVAGMLNDAGIRTKQIADDYASVYQNRTWGGDMPGLVFGLGTQFGDPDQFLDYLFGPTSTRNHMRVNDPVFNDLFKKQRAELDADTRREILIQIQKYLASVMRFIPLDYRAVAGYSLAYPFVKNIRAYRSASGSYGAASEGFLYRWLDK